MKIKKEHYDILSAALEEVKKKFPEITLEKYRKEKIGKDHDMRWRWDMFYLANKHFFPEEFKRGGVGGQLVLYEYMNDTHIDTAIRKILQ